MIMSVSVNESLTMFTVFGTEYVKGYVKGYLVTALELLELKSAVYVVSLIQ